MSRQAGVWASRYLVIAFGLTGCWHKSAPFTWVAAGYTVYFPATAEDIQRAYPAAIWKSALEPNGLALVDTTRQKQVVWRCTYAPGDQQAQLYGALITLVGKGNKMDSVQAAFERQYGQPFRRLNSPVYLDESEFYQPDSSLRVMQISPDVQLTLSRQKAWDGIIEPPTIADNITLSICYGRDEEENERFALTQRIVRRRDD